MGKGKRANLSKKLLVISIFTTTALAIGQVEPHYKKNTHKKTQSKATSYTHKPRTIEPYYIKSKKKKIKSAPKATTNIRKTLDGGWIKTKTVRSNIQAETKFFFNRHLRRGSLKTISEAKSGYNWKKWQTIYDKNGKVKSHKIVAIGKKDPVHNVIHMGPGGFPISRDGFKRSKIINLKATAYTASPRENGGYVCTKTGMKLIDGVCAVDPRVIPLNSLLYIEGDFGGGIYLANDTGGAIKGHRIDVMINNYRKMRKFGRRNVKVHVLGKLDGKEIRKSHPQLFKVSRRKVWGRRKRKSNCKTTTKKRRRVARR